MTRASCSNCGTTLPVDARFCVECGARAAFEERSLTQRLQEELGSDYEVMGELGHGGFGVVYLMGDRRERRYLAVKVMHQRLMVSPLLVERFRREIRYASKLNHVNILPVTFSVDRGNLVYYAMPRVRGKPLKKHLEQRAPFSPSETTRILREIAAGLSSAHEHGVMHRDIKPSNIMLEHSGKVLILDFGVAKALSKDGGTLSISGELLGSPEYMSPEQAAGKKDVDHRTDVYSWGIVGYEMLTGRPPFSGKSVQQVLHRHMTEVPESLSQLRPDAPPPLVSILERALEKDRDRRWQTMADAMAQLDAVPQT